jgi:hypothetical protein
MLANLALANLVSYQQYLVFALANGPTSGTLARAPSSLAHESSRRCQAKTSSRKRTRFLLGVMDT